MPTLTEKKAEGLEGEYYAKLSVIPQPAVIHPMDVTEVLQAYLDAGDPMPGEEHMPRP